MHRILRVFLLLWCAGIFSCKEKKPPPAPPAAVNIFTVKKKHVFYYDTYPSTTEALSQVSLLPQVQGYITGIFFLEGAHVKKGQKLYEIDKRLYQAALDAALSNVKVAEGNQTQAKQDAERYTYLNNYHAVAKQLYDHAVTTLDNSKAQVEGAEEAVKTAKTNLAYSTIYAPFDGTIGFSMVKLGNLAVAGQTILNTISTNDPMAVDFVINEKQLMNFEKMEKTKQPAVDSLFTLLLPNNTLYPQTGKISIIDRAVDPQTGSIRVRLVFPNPENTLKVGMSCIVRVHNQDAAPQMVIPGKAVVEQMGEYFVFVVKDTIMNASMDSSKQKEADTAAQHGPIPRAFQKKVQVGQTLGAEIIIKSGIDDDDRIVIDGVQSLHDGSPVTIGKKPERANGTGNSDKKSAGYERKMDSSKTQ